MYFGDQRTAIFIAMLLQVDLPGWHAEIHRKGWVYRYYFTPSLTVDVGPVSVQVFSTPLE